MLDDTQEEDLAEWWRDSPGLYEKSCTLYHHRAKKNKLIADKAASMGVMDFDATMLHGWMKSMHTMYDKEELAPLSSRLVSSGWWIPSSSSILTSRWGAQGRYLAKYFH